ncbi:DUF4397 domain-containing protein [Kribbella antibiotica]|uniref:DUF4397 domain-containing protein n=1 Tax=Kribbella antibiotica TaxID=190195 RepID=A0A4V2YNV5_9ACTN|nr:DUF4397 domain-containing protein [Kribbella antibiotica]
MNKRRVSERCRAVYSRIRGPVIPLLVAAAVISAPLAPAEAAAGGNLYIVQGLPGQSLDISVDGRAVATKVPAAKLLGPIGVSAGQRTITAKKDGKVVIERQVTVGSGGSLDVVIHQPASPGGAPVITSYNNKLTAVPADKAAVRVAHTAAVGPADIRVNGQVLFANVANGESLDVVVPAATYSVEIVPAGAKSPVVLGPLALPVKAGYLTRVFAVGAPSAKTMTVAVGTIKLRPSGTPKPKVVDTGAGPDQTAALAGIALLLLLAAAVTTRKVIRR